MTFLFISRTLNNRKRLYKAKMNDSDFQLWLNKISLSDFGKDYITRVRNSDPSRRVKSTSINVSGNYPSQKMQRTIQFESHKNELALIVQLEHDAEVLEYWDQPDSIKFFIRQMKVSRTLTFTLLIFWLLKMIALDGLNAKHRRNWKKFQPNRIAIALMGKNGDLDPEKILLKRTDFFFRFMHQTKPTGYI